MSKEIIPSQELIWRFLQAAIVRLSHMEELLVGLATLGVAGWAFLHGRKEQGKPETGTVAIRGRIVFTILFSGLVASAFNVLFAGRMMVNLSVLKLEDELIGPVHPYLGFFVSSGSLARPIYYLTAFFVPAISVSSMIITIMEMRGRNLNVKKGLGIVYIISALSIIGSSFISLSSIEKTMGYATYLMTHQRW